MADTPRIYLANLAAYNAGRLAGEWVDATDLGELEAAAGRIRGDWAIHDQDGFGPVRLDEHETLEHVAELAAGIDEHGAPFAAYVAAGYEPADFEEAYAGEWSTLAEFAEDLLEDIGDLGQIPERLRGYFDFAKYARDLERGGDVFTEPAPGGVYVYWANV